MNAQPPLGEHGRWQAGVGEGGRVGKRGGERAVVRAAKRAAMGLEEEAGCARGCLLRLGPEGGRVQQPLTSSLLD